MWKLNKPNLQDSIDDIDNMLSCSCLDKNMKSNFVYLYEQYDNNKGYVTDEQHDLLNVDSNEMKNLYDKTKGDRKLSYIRSSLINNISYCPLCGIGEPNTLDHYMPQSKYGALSVCRQNLVPVCYDCNNKKLDKDFSGFVHCYYEKYPTDKPFFNFDFSVSNSVLVPEISITHVSEELKNKIKNQIDKLNLKMRWQRSINSFLYQILSTNIENQKMLEDNLKALNETYEKTFHKNDWRTAVIRGLINCEDFTYEVAKIYIDNPNPINDGGV